MTNDDRGYPVWGSARPEQPEGERDDIKLSPRFWTIVTVEVAVFLIFAAVLLYQMFT